MENLEDFKQEVVSQVAKFMCVAALTAPKARGVNNLLIKVAEGEDIKKLSDKLEELYIASGQEFLHRDALNILHSQAVVLIGSKVAALGLDCGYCGYTTCQMKNETSPLTPCFFNANDLGIAVGSACNKAADCKVDSRVMFSVGLAAKNLGMLADCPTVLAIALSASEKSIFFDRK